MRKAFQETLKKLIIKNQNLVLLLCDIGVYSFNSIMKKYPKRVLNMGILEQSTVSFAAGLSLRKFIPVIHTISPFLVNRAFEQIKIDFGYQELKGNFITVGASYDYASLGCTHHCPEDINLMKNIPNMKIFVPGTGLEFNQLFLQSFKKNKPNYFRLSTDENKKSQKVIFGKANIIKKGGSLTIIAVGPVLNFLENFIKKKNCNLLYYTSIRPFDKSTLKRLKKKTKKIIIIEPYYGGSILDNVLDVFKDQKININTINVPFEFIRKYGNKKDIDNKIKFTEKTIKNKLNELV